MYGALAVDTSRDGRALPQPAAPNPSPHLPALAVTHQAFRIGSHWFYCGFDEASELVDPLSAHWLPNTPAWFVGLAHLNGFVVPVLDLESSLHGSEQGTRNRPQQPLFHLIVGRQLQRIAVAIDSLPFTVTAVAPTDSAADMAGPATPLVSADWVDATLPWSQVSHTAQGSVALASDGQPPQVLHHLSAALLEQWFLRSVAGQI